MILFSKQCSLFFFSERNVFWNENVFCDIHNQFVFIENLKGDYFLAFHCDLQKERKQ